MDNDCHINDWKPDPERENFKAPPREMAFLASFSWAYENLRGNPHSKDGVLLVVTSETIEDGRETIRQKLLRSYPNINIKSITYRED